MFIHGSEDSEIERFIKPMMEADAGKHQVLLSMLNAAKEPAQSKLHLDLKYMTCQMCDRLVRT